MTNCLVHLKTR